MSFADQIEVFYGRITHSSAEVYVRVPTLVGGAEWSIAGQVRGPIAPDTRTLPMTIALTDRGAGPSLLGGCSIPDPTFWTTQLPGTYEVSIQLRRDGKVVESVVRTLGIRFFGASGRNFLWEGKRWVLRGVSPGIAVESVDDFRDNAGVLVVKHPSEPLLRRASEAGVMLVAEIESGDLPHELRRLSQWPAVAIVILPSDCDVSSDVRAVAPNLLFAERVTPSKAESPAAWAQAVFCDEHHVERLRDTLGRSPLPLVAERQLNRDYTLSEARRECDHLQRDLAPLGDLAGYIVRF